MKEMKDLNRDIGSWFGGLAIINIWILSKFSYILIQFYKNHYRLFVHMGKLILKVIWEGKELEKLKQF